MVEYAELEGVVYRTRADGFFAEHAYGGAWTPGGSNSRVCMYGRPMTESEARKFLGSEWPEGP
jgi:hypothetical protein